MAQDKAYRFKWGVSNVKYKGEELGKKEIELEELYVGLRTNQGLELDQFPKVIIDKFKQWQERDLAVLTDKNIFLNSKGFVILDSLMDELFALKAI